VTRCRTVQPRGPRWDAIPGALGARVFERHGFTSIGLLVAVAILDAALTDVGANPVVG
jgi:hypothetical protein